LEVSKKNNIANNREGVPGTSKVPVLGKVLSGKSNSDTMNELLVFIAPRIL
jgi:type IV pilus assembly protein PilQ